MTVVHLAVPGLSRVAACGRRSKRTTLSAGAVTCTACRGTWDFALAAKRPECCRDSPWPKYPRNGLRITIHGIPRWARHL